MRLARDSSSNETKPTAVDRIEEAELEYMQHVLELVRSSQASYQQWSRYLAAKYHMSGGDQLMLDGTIVRAVKP